MCLSNLSVYFFFKPSAVAGFRSKIIKMSQKQIIANNIEKFLMSRGTNRPRNPSASVYTETLREWIAECGLSNKIRRRDVCLCFSFRQHNAPDQHK